MAPQVKISAGSLIVFMMLFCGYPLLQSHYVGFNSRDNYVEQNVSINLHRPVFTVSEKFLSVAIDSGIMMHHWPYVNFTSERFFNLAKGLSPAFLRIGGTAEDFLIYDDSQGLQKPKNFSNFTITHQDLDRIHLLSSKAGWDVMFGLNVLLRNQDGSWDASNPKEIMQYVAEHGYNFGWELGNGKKYKCAIHCRNVLQSWGRGRLLCKSLGRDNMLQHLNPYPILDKLDFANLS